MPHIIGLETPDTVAYSVESADGRYRYGWYFSVEEAVLSRSRPDDAVVMHPEGRGTPNYECFYRQCKCPVMGEEEN